MIGMIDVITQGEGGWLPQTNIRVFTNRNTNTNKNENTNTNTNTHTSYLSFFLHGHYFGLKFPPHKSA